MTNKVYIFFEDYHNDGLDKVVEATEDEWQRLIAPAIMNKHPIDGATVDDDMLAELLNRPGVDLKLSEVRQIERVVPMV